MLTSQNIQNICFSDSQLQSLTPNNQVSYFNRMTMDKTNSFAPNGQGVNLDSLCEKVFINNRSYIPGSDSKQLFNSQGDGGVKRVSSGDQLINMDRVPPQNYHEQSNLMKMMRQQSVETIKQKQLHPSHLQLHDGKIYQNQINQQPSIGRVSPPYNGQPPNLYPNYPMHQDELGQALVRLANLEEGPNERLSRVDMTKMKHQNAQGRVHLQPHNAFPKIINKKKQQSHLQLPSSQAFKEKCFKQAPPYLYRQNWINQVCSPYIKEDFRERSNSLKGTDSKFQEPWLRYSNKRSCSRASPISTCTHKRPAANLASGRNNLQKHSRNNSRINGGVKPVQDCQYSITTPMLDCTAGAGQQKFEQQNIIEAAANIIQALTPILKNAHENSQDKNEYFKYPNNNCGKTQSTCNETQKPFEMTIQSKQTGQETQPLPPALPTESRGRNNGGFHSVSPRESSGHKDSKELQQRLLNCKQPVNFTTEQMYEAGQYMKRSSNISQKLIKQDLQNASIKSKCLNQKNSLAQKNGLFSLQSKEKREVQIINDCESDSESQFDKVHNIQASEDHEGFIPVQKQTKNEKFMTSPKINRKAKNQVRKGQNTKKNLASTSMVQIQSPITGFNEGEKQISSLGKRKNRNKKQDSADSDQFENSKKQCTNVCQMVDNQHIVQTQDQTFQTTANDVLEQSPLGLAMKKIGIKIGVETGLLLNKYIGKKSDKNQILNKKGNSNKKQSKQCQEKSPEKSQKSKQSAKCNNRSQSKKRIKKQVSKITSKQKNLERKARTQEPLQEQHLGDNDQEFLTTKTLAEDAMSSTFCLKSTYIPMKGIKNYNNDTSEMDGMRQTQASANNFGCSDDKSIAQNTCSLSAKFECE